MTLPERLDLACRDWCRGAAVIVLTAIAGAIPVGLTYAAFVGLGSLLGEPSSWAMNWTSGLALIWYPLVGGLIIRELRGYEAGLSAQTALTAQDQPRPL